MPLLRILCLLIATLNVVAHIVVAVDALVILGRHASFPVLLKYRLLFLLLDHGRVLEVSESLVRVDSGRLVGLAQLVLLILVVVFEELLNELKLLLLSAGAALLLRLLILNFLKLFL